MPNPTSNQQAEEQIKEVLLPYELRKDFRYGRYVEWEGIEWEASNIFKNSNACWSGNHHNAARRIGMIMPSLRQLPISASLQRWEKHYTTKISDWLTIYENIKHFSKKEGYFWEDAVNMWWIRVIDQSWEGRRSEREVMDSVKEHFRKRREYIVSDADEEDDIKLGVDLIVRERVKARRGYEEVVVFGIQVKPASYFYGRSAANINEREVINPKKYKLFMEKYPEATVFYMTIDDVRKGIFKLIDALPDFQEKVA